MAPPLSALPLIKVTSRKTTLQPFSILKILERSFPLIMVVPPPLMVMSLLMVIPSTYAVSNVLSYA